MTRGPCCLNTGLKKGPWSAEEDEILITHIRNHGHSNWRALPKQAGLLRCGKSCRLRWTNYLNPNIKRGNFSREEEETVIELHRVLGNRWSAIAAELPGRTDNEIKNVWHTHLKKRLMQLTATGDHQPAAAYDDARVKQMKTATASHQSNSTVSLSDSDDAEVYITNKYEEFVEYCGEYKPEMIDERFWSDEQSSQLTTTTTVAEADDPFSHIQFPSFEEAESSRGFSYLEDDLEFWCNILVQTDGMTTMTELPEF